MTESPHTSSIINHQRFAEALHSWIRTFEESVCHVDLLASIVHLCQHTGLLLQLKIKEGRLEKRLIGLKQARAHDSLMQQQPAWFVEAAQFRVFFAKFFKIGPVHSFPPHKAPKLPTFGPGQTQLICFRHTAFPPKRDPLQPKPSFRCRENWSSSGQVCPITWGPFLPYYGGGFKCVASDGNSCLMIPS